MADYITRSDAIKAVNGQNAFTMTRGALIDALNSIPAADVAPMVHGRWTEVDWVEMEICGNELIRTPNAALRCSNCRNCFKKELLWKDAYCTNCVAKMDGGADNADDAAG